MPASRELKYTTYVDSPLGHLLAEALQKIAVIKKKYPLDKKTASKDVKKAAGLVNATETMLKILHNNLLPKFNNGNVPYILGFIPSIPDFVRLNSLQSEINAQENMLIGEISKRLCRFIKHAKTINDCTLTDSINSQLEQYKAELFKSAPKSSHKELNEILNTIKSEISLLNLESRRADALFEIQRDIEHHLVIESLTPRHPMTYELMEVMAELITNAPENLADTVSFFNPNVVPKLLSNGIIAGQLKKYTGIHKVEHLQNNDTRILSYSYKLTKEAPPIDGNKEGKTCIEERHLEAEYVEERSCLLNELVVPTTRRYLAIYGAQHMIDMPEAATVIQKGLKSMKSDFARLEILQALTSVESQSILTPVSALTEKATLFFNTNPTPALADLEELLKSYQDIIDTLSGQRTHYTSITIDALLQTSDNATTLATFKGHQDAQLDVSYSKKPLPEVATCTTEGALAIQGRIIPIRAQLFSNIDTSLQTLEHGKEFILRQIKALQTQSDKATTDALYAESLKSVNVEGIQQRLEKTTKQLAFLQEQKHTLTERLQATETRCASLKETLPITSEAVAQKQQELAELQNQLGELRQPIEQILATLTKNTDTRAANLKKTQKYQRLLELLPTITGILRDDLKTTKKKPKISFKAIDAIINPNIPSTEVYSGFLRLVEDIAPDSMVDWKKYCSQQEAMFKINPSRHEFDLMINTLLQCIDTKIPELTEWIQTNAQRDIALNEQKEQLQEQLGGIADQCSPISTRATLLEQELSLFNAITRFEEECKAMRLQIEGLATDEIDTQNQQGILKELLAIIAAIGSLKLNVDGVSNATVSIMAPLQEAHNLITQRISDVSIAITKVADAPFYQTNLDAITQLLNPIGLKIDELSVLAEQQQVLESERLKKEQRIALIGTYMNQLTTYTQTRADKYKFKDFFSSTDKTKRHDFIETLQRQLEAYKESGNNDEALKSIRNNIARFPGKGLQPLLHGITIALIETKDPLPAIKEGMEVQHNTAKKILTALDPKKTPYAKIMMKLYEKIKFMEQYGSKLTKNKDNSGAAVTSLAKKLREDTDLFINDHGINLPSKVKYNEFQEKFMARLHSKDNIMSEHSNIWFPIVGNIALLILLIPKLIYSKFSTGHCSFFFETTKKNALIDAIDKQAREMAPTIAPAC